MGSNKFFKSSLILLLALIAVGCSNDMAIEEPIPATPAANSALRSSEEAIAIATEAYNAHFPGNNNASRSRSGKAQATVSVIRQAASRSAGSDTCLYVVNFGEDDGFALIAADRDVDPVFGVSDCGHYDDLIPITNPGLNYYVGRTVQYLSSLDRSKAPQRDISIVPDDRLQVKEWEDSTFTLKIENRVNNAWIQGIKNTDTELTLSTLDNNPTGFYFNKYRCGSPVIAIAHAMLYFEYPSVIHQTWDSINPNKYNTPEFTADWKAMQRHSPYFYLSNGASGTWGCNASEREASHQQIAWLCRAIGNKCKVQEYGHPKPDIISAKLNDVTEAIRYFGFHTDKWWYEYTKERNLSESREIIIMAGSDASIPECPIYWIIDGEKIFTARHHYATKKFGEPWTEIITSTYSKDLVHINWGEGPKGNGWFDKTSLLPKYSTNVRYADPSYNFIAK